MSARARRRSETGGPAGRPSAPSRSAQWRPFVLVVLAAWAARALFLLRQSDARGPASVLYRGDTPFYLESALAMVQGRPYDSGIPFHPPGFTTLLAALLRLTGVSAAQEGFDALPAKLILGLLGALAIGVFFLLARRVAGRTVALVALPLSIFSFGHYVQSTAINAESSFLLLALTVVLGWSLVAERCLQPAPAGGAGADLKAGAAGPGPVAGPGLQAGARAPRLAAGPGLPAMAGVLGLLAGAAALMRPEFLLTMSLLLIVALLLGRRRALLPAALFLLGALVLLAPWTLHCRRNIAAVNRANAERLPRPLPEWVLVSAGGPLNFATANNDHASGAFDTRLIEKLAPGRPALELDLAHAEIHRLYVDGYAVGARWMLANPSRALALFARKLDLAFDALALGYLQGNLPGGLTGERRPVDQFVPRARAFRWAQAALCLLGIVHLRGVLADRRRRAAALFLAAHGLATLLAILAFFGYARFGMLLAPIFWLLLAAGMTAIFGWLRGPGRAAPPRLSAGRAVAGLIGLLLLVETLSAASGSQAFELSGDYLPGTRRINPDDRVLIQARR